MRRRHPRPPWVWPHHTPSSGQCNSLCSSHPGTQHTGPAVAHHVYKPRSLSVSDVCNTGRTHRDAMYTASRACAMLPLHCATVCHCVRRRYGRNPRVHMSHCIARMRDGRSLFKTHASSTCAMHASSFVNANEPTGVVVHKEPFLPTANAPLGTQVHCPRRASSLFP